MGRIYIAIAGNIGAGKSTLVDFLCRTYGVQPFFEPNDENPYLADFYAAMNSEAAASQSKAAVKVNPWAFHSQVFFLTHKFRIHQELDRTPGIVVQDRTIYEDAEVFATALHRSGRISQRDWKTYSELYSAITNAIQPPDLMVYLRCSMKTTKQRIKMRGRSMEQDIPTSYLKLLQENYDDWFKRWRTPPADSSKRRTEVLELDTDRLDYISDLVDRLDVIERIERCLSAADGPPRLDPRAVRAARAGLSP